MAGIRHKAAAVLYCVHLFNCPGMAHGMPFIRHCERFHNGQGTGKPSELVDIGLDIDSQVGKLDSYPLG